MYGKASQLKFFSDYSESVLKVRKRITLMVITVSVIFAVCWGAESVEYVLRFLANLKISFVHIATVDMMVLVQFSCEPLCLFPPKPSVQKEDQGSDALHERCGGSQASERDWH